MTTLDEARDFLVDLMIDHVAIGEFEIAKGHGELIRAIQGLDVGILPSKDIMKNLQGFMAEMDLN